MAEEVDRCAAERGAGPKTVHQSHQSLELEFYVPAAVWKHPATKSFLAGVASLVGGATVQGGAKGVWHGETETTNLVRVIIRDARVRKGELLAEIRKAVDGLMASWATSPEHRQASFLFTVRELTVHEARLNDAPVTPREAG